MQENQFVETAFGSLSRAMVGGGADFTYYKPNPLPRDLDLNQSTVLALSEADAALGLLNGLGRLIRDPEVLLGPFIKKEALASSRIEGTKASLSEVLQAEAADEDDLRTDDVAEVNRYLSATYLALELAKELPITERMLRRVHAELMQGVRGEEKLPGEFRRSPVWIGAADATPNTARFVPPLPEQIAELMTDWERYVNLPVRMPSLVRAAMAHYQFETIHPFLDGNGRIGRLMVGLMLMADDRLSRPLLYLSGYLEMHRDEYYGRLQAVREKGDYQEYLQFFLVAVRRQSEDAVHRANLLVDLREKYYKQIEIDRSRVGAVIPMIFRTPFIHAKRVELTLGQAGNSITPQGARNLLARAEELGWIEKFGYFGRGGRTLYIAREVLDVIEAPNLYEH